MLRVCFAVPFALRCHMLTVHIFRTQEANVIRGALDLTSKQALVGMTPMEKVRAGARSCLVRLRLAGRQRHDAHEQSLQLCVSAT